MSGRAVALLVLFCALVAGLTGGLVGWGVASNVAGVGVPGADGAAGENGVAGAPGQDGADGEDGDDGIDGSTGATGTAGTPGRAGARGPQGATGAAGPDGSPGTPGTAGGIGPPGPPGTDGADGADGASAPTFTFSSSSGTGANNGGYSFGTMTDLVPAGPALIGFSIEITPQSPTEEEFRCFLEDVLSGDELATTGIQNVVGSETVALTQVVTLDSESQLRLRCAPGFPLPVFGADYASQSIYAISFAG